MGRKKAKDYRKSNYDRGDGLKTHRLQEQCPDVSKRSHMFCMFDTDNVVMYMDNGDRFKVSIVKELRRLNRYKCNRINGYNGNLNGDNDG